MWEKNWRFLAAKHTGKYVAAQKIGKFSAHLVRRTEGVLKWVHWRFQVNISGVV